MKTAGKSQDISKSHPPDRYWDRRSISHTCSENSQTCFYLLPGAFGEFAVTAALRLLDKKRSGKLMPTSEDRRICHMQISRSATRSSQVLQIGLQHLVLRVEFVRLFFGG